MASEPIYQPMLFHMTFVAVDKLPWPLDGFAFQASCRACDWAAPRTRATYGIAWNDAKDHEAFPSS